MITDKSLVVKKNNDAKSTRANYFFVLDKRNANQTAFQKRGKINNGNKRMNYKARPFKSA